MGEEARERRQHLETAFSQSQLRRETPSGAGALRRALAYLRSYTWESAVAVLSLLLVSGANLATPLFIGRAIDEGIGPRRLGVIFVVVGWLVGLALARALFTFLQGYLAESASQGVAYDLRDALFERIEKLSFSYYDSVQTGQLVTRLTSDVEQIRTCAGSGVAQLANAVVMLIGTTILLLYLHWRLALVAPRGAPARERTLQRDPRFPIALPLGDSRMNGGLGTARRKPGSLKGKEWT